jgi:hypothetical protein
MQMNTTNTETAFYALAQRINSQGDPRNQLEQAKAILKNNEIFKNGVAGRCDGEIMPVGA